MLSQHSIIGVSITQKIRLCCGVAIERGDFVLYVLLLESECNERAKNTGGKVVFLVWAKGKCPFLMYRSLYNGHNLDFFA
jgi:hypothetical protein